LIATVDVEDLERLASHAKDVKIVSIQRERASPTSPLYARSRSTS
jgi:hypothetical protein